MRRLALALSALILTASVAQAAPITIGAQTFEALISVEQVTSLIPGTIGHLEATIQNIGPTAMTFQNWNAAFPPGGYGFNSTTNAWALYSGRVGTITDPRLHYGTGTGTPGSPDADLSELSGVTIAPGGSLSFILWSLLLDPDVALGSTGLIDSRLELIYGGTTLYGWESSGAYDMNWTAADVASHGGSADVPLTVITPRSTNPFPNGGGPIGTPEPSSLLLGFAGLAWVTRRTFA